MRKGGRKMNHRVRVVFAAALIIVFGIFLPSTLLFHDVNTFVKEAKSHTQAEAKYTNEIGDQILQGSYLRSEGQKGFFSDQRIEQRRSDYQLSIGFLMFFAFALGICLKRVYLSYIQFYSFPFARFLCEYDTLLAKDGKQRALAFTI